MRRRAGHGTTAPPGAVRRIAGTGVALLGVVVLLFTLLLLVTEVHQLVVNSTSTLRPEFRDSTTTADHLVQFVRSGLWMLGSALWLVGAGRTWRHRRPSGPSTIASGSLAILVGTAVQMIGVGLGSAAGPVIVVAAVVASIIGVVAVVGAARATEYDSS